MKSLRVLSILTIIAISISVVGCQPATAPAQEAVTTESQEAVTTASQETANAEKESFHIVVVNNMTTLPHFGPTYDGIDTATKEISAWTGDEITYEIVGPTENDVLKEAEAMEAAIAKKPDGFLIVVWDPAALTPAINKAVAAGIPVISVDAGAPDSDQLMYIGTDWVQTGIALAEALAEAIDGKGEVAMIGLTSLPQQQVAFGSFEDTMAEKYPDVVVYGPEDDNSEETKAAEVASALMIKYPDLVGFAGFDNASGTGIATAVREAGKSGIVKVVGNDMNVPQLEAINEGTQTFALGQAFKWMGYWGVLSMYVQLKSDFQFTSDDAAAGLQKIPPRIVTGFLSADSSNTDLYIEAFEKYTK
jgi:ribose transport system substrate-binding protein